VYSFAVHSATLVRETIMAVHGWGTYCHYAQKEYTVCRIYITNGFVAYFM